MRPEDASRNSPRWRPEDYSQYKQEVGASLEAGDLAHYFNKEIFSAGHKVEFLKSALEHLTTSTQEERERLLVQLTQLEKHLELAHSIANDAFQALEKARRDNS